MRIGVTNTPEGARVTIGEAYQGLVLTSEVNGDLHVCHRDGGIEVWEAKVNGRMLWSSTGDAVSRALVNTQANDKGLWFPVATTPQVDHLQKELRRLHAMVEVTHP